MCLYDGAYACHVYVGAIFSGTNASASSVQFTMSIPNGTPVGADGNALYYLLLSIWDNGNSYDQIGIGDANEYIPGYGPYYTSWTLFYSAWYYCSSSNPISGSNSAFTLTPGDQYTFRMVAHSNGTIEFDLYPGTNYFLPWWTAWVHTGGTTFDRSAYSPAGCPGYQGYTDYEEMYSVTGGAQPAWELAFDNNEENGQAQTSWSAFQSRCSWLLSTGSPRGYPTCMDLGLDQVWSDLAAYTTTSGQVVSIWNQWFTNTLAPTICVPDEGWCELSINRGTSQVFSGSLSATPSCSQGLQSNGIGSGQCSSGQWDFLLLQFPTTPLQASDLGGCAGFGVASGGCVCPTASGGWTCSFGGSGITNNSGFVPHEAMLPFSYTFKIGVPSTASCGLYLLKFNVTTQYYNGVNGVQWDWNSFEFAVLVGGCGGGGCVAWGTPILTATGYVPVQRLSVGETLIGYNLTSGQQTQEALEANNATWVDSFVVVDRGLLVVTPTDQPIFMKNISFAGWLRDPQNLTVGDWIFDPVSGNWTFVYSVSLQRGHIKVFDVVTNGSSDFIANGILLDMKA